MHKHISYSFRKCMELLKSTHQSFSGLQKGSPFWSLTFLRSQLGRMMVVSQIKFSKHLNKGCIGKTIQSREKAVQILYLSLSSYVNLISESHLKACKIQILIPMLKNCSELKVIHIKQLLTSQHIIDAGSFPCSIITCVYIGYYLLCHKNKLLNVARDQYLRILSRKLFRKARSTC